MENMNPTIHNSRCISTKNAVQYRIRKLVNMNIDRENSNRLKSASISGKIQGLAIALLCVAACVYHAKLRIDYFYTSPKAVNLLMEERNEGYLPALFLITFYTEEFDEFITNFSERLGKKKVVRCGDMVEYYLRFNGTDVKTLWRLLDAASIVKNTSFVGGKGMIKIDSANTLVGTASKILYTEPVAFGDSRLQFIVTLNHPDIEEELCGMRMIIASTMLQEKKNSLDDNLWFVNPEIRTQFAVALREYRILNETNNVCVSIQQRETCTENCFITNIPEYNCRFLFDPRENLPFCNGSESTAEHLLATHEKFSEILPSEHCLCPKVCNNVVIITHTDVDFTGEPAIELYVREKFVRVMVQRHAYTFISLLCDIGGILGLYLGLSCLSFMNMAISYVTNWINRSKNANFLQDPLYPTIIDIMREERFNTKKSTEVDRQNSIFKHIRRLIWVLSILIWSYQTYNLLAYYFDYPLTVTIELKEDDIVQLPSVVMCTDTGQLIFVKKHYAKKSGRNVTCLRHGLDLLDLLDPPSSLAGKSIKLWKKSDTTESKIFSNEYAGLLVHNRILSAKFGRLSSMSTVYGNCTMATLDPLQYNRISSNLWTLFSRALLNERPSCDCHIKHFLIAPVELFDLKKSIYHPCDMVVDVLYFVQTILRINTYSSPCMPPDVARKCENKCFNAKLERSISCKLPFMSSMTIPLCNDSISAKRTRELYFVAHLKTNPLVDCHCQKRCRETIFLPTTTHINEFLKLEMTIVKYNLESNIREIIAEKLAFPVEKLLCDVGSNLGIVLGMSLLSIFHAIIDLCKYIGLWCQLT